MNDGCELRTDGQQLVVSYENGDWAVMLDFLSGRCNNQRQ